MSFENIFLAILASFSLYWLFSLFAIPLRAQSLQLCPALCDTVDNSLPGSSVPGTVLPRILEWVAMPSSRESSIPRDWTCVSCVSRIAGRCFTTESLGKPQHNTDDLQKHNAERRKPRHRKSYRAGLHSYEVFRTGKPTETESRLVAARGWVVWRMGLRRYMFLSGVKMFWN